MSEPVASRPAAPEPAVVEAPPAPPELPATGPLKGKSADEITAILKSAIDNNRIDLYLQPVVTLPQRKVRYYEAMTRLRTEDGTLILPSDFLAHAEKSGLIPRIDNVQLFRCVQVLRRLLLKNREIGLFCNVSVQTLNDPDVYRQFFDFLEANRALSSVADAGIHPSALREMGPLEQESLASLIALGFRFSMDHVTDLRIGPRDLSDLGIRFVKIPAALLLEQDRRRRRYPCRRAVGPARAPWRQPDRRTDRGRGVGGGSAGLRCALRPGLSVLAAASGPRRGAAGHGAMPRSRSSRSVGREGGDLRPRTPIRHSPALGRRVREDERKRDDAE